MQINMKVSFKFILLFWVSLARPSQCTHNSSIWIVIMQQKVVTLIAKKLKYRMERIAKITKVESH